MDKRIDILKKKNVLGLSGMNVEVRGRVEVVTYQGKPKKRKIIIRGDKINENYLIIPNKKYENSLNLLGNNYIMNCILSLNCTVLFKYCFSITQSPKEIIFSFKYPLNKTNILVVKNKILIDIPIEVTEAKGEIEKSIIINPRQFIKENEEKFNNDIKNLERRNIILKRIEIYPNIEVCGIYIDKEIDYVKIYLEQEKERKLKEENEKAKIDLEKRLKEEAELSGLNHSSQTKKEIKFSIIEEEEKSNSSHNEMNNDSINNISMNDISTSQINNNSIYKMETIDRQSVHSSTMSHHPLQNTQLTNSTLPILSQSTISFPNISNISSKLPPIQNAANSLLPQPIYSLAHISGKFKFLLSDGENYFYDSNDIVIKISSNSQQNFYSTEIKNNPIDIFKLTNDGNLLIIAQGKFITIKNIKEEKSELLIQTKYKKILIMNVDISNKYLLCVGKDNNDKNDVFTIFDIDKNPPTLYITQISPYSISDMDFDFNDTSTMFSCGKASIRLWSRTAHDCLLGKNVLLENHLRDHFSMFKFDINNANYAFVVCETKGELLYVNFNDLFIESVFKVSNVSITSIIITKKTVVIGTCQGDVKAWENNVNNVYSSENVIADGNCKEEIICLSPINDEEALIGNINGEIFKINFINKKCIQIEENIFHDSVVNGSVDGNILAFITDKKEMKIFNENKLIFTYNKEKLNTLLLLNKKVFCGLENGAVCSFDIEKEFIQSKPQFISNSKNGKKYYPIISMKSANQNKILLALNAKGDISIIDIEEGLITIKEIINPSTHNKINEINVSVSTEYFGFSISDSLLDSNTVFVYSLHNFELKSKISISSCLISRFCLIHQNLLCVILKNWVINFYALNSTKEILIKSVFNSQHKSEIDLVTVSKNYKYIFTFSYGDGSVIIWSGMIPFSNRILMQKIVVNELGVQRVFFDEATCDLITVNKVNGRITTWKFKGEIVFTDNEIEGNIRKLTDIEYVNNLVEKNSTKVYINVDKGKGYGNSFDKYMTLLKNKKKEINKDYDEIIPGEEKKNPNDELIKINKDEIKKREELMTLKSSPLKTDFHQKLTYYSIDDYYDSLTSIYSNLDTSRSNIDDSFSHPSSSEIISKQLKKKLLLPPNSSYLPERSYHTRYFIFLIHIILVKYQQPLINFLLFQIIFI